jgi:hypothetical protein
MSSGTCEKDTIVMRVIEFLNIPNLNSNFQISFFTDKSDEIVNSDHRHINGVNVKTVTALAEIDSASIFRVEFAHTTCVYVYICIYIYTYTVTSKSL